MKKKLISVLLASVMSISVLIGCATPEKEVENEKTNVSEPDGELTLESLGVEFLVPDGEMIPDIPEEFGGRPTSSLEDFAKTLSSEELQKIAEGGYTAAFCTFDAQSAWGRSMAAAVKDTLEKLNIDLVVSTDGAQTVQTCVENFESAMQVDPDVVIVVAMDPGAEKQGWDEAIAAGTKIVFIQSVPDEYVCGEDYYGVVIPDHYTQNYVGSRQMLEEVGEGEVVYINIKYDNIENEVRQIAFADACKEFPNIIQLDTETIMSIEEATAFAESMAQTHPELKGVSGLWDELVMASINSMNDLGMNVKGGTNGISEISALSMIRGTGYIGSGSEAAYDMGSGAALLAVAALAGIECPELLMTPTVVINRENLEESWYKTYHEALPSNLQSALDEAK